MEVNEYPFAPYLFRPNQDQCTRITHIGYVFLHGLYIMERYVTTTYRSHELHIGECARWIRNHYVS